MLNHELMLVSLGPVALEDGPVRIRVRSTRALRELSSLGLTREASLGILRVLTRAGAQRASIDPNES